MIAERVRRGQSSVDCAVRVVMRPVVAVIIHEGPGVAHARPRIHDVDAAVLVVQAPDASYPNANLILLIKSVVFPYAIGRYEFKDVFDHILSREVVAANIRRGFLRGENVRRIKLWKSKTLGIWSSEELVNSLSEKSETMSYAPQSYEIIF